MDKTERFEGLSAEQISTLRERRRSALRSLITAPVVYLLFAALVIFSRSWLYIIIYFLLATLPMLLFLLSAILSILALNTDIREGKRQVLVSRVESQRQDIRDVGRHNNVQMQYTYLIKVNGKEMKVSEEQYYRCKPGQVVEVHLAPKSKYVFALNVQDDATQKADATSGST